MKANVSWAGVCVVLCVSFLSVRFANANDPKAEPGPAKPPELQVLDRLVGAWEGEGTAKPAARAPTEKRSRGALTRAWGLNGRFVQGKGGTAGKPTLGMSSYEFPK